ncbi:MAG: proline iminopeptidase-family hydrolase [Heyndrickxia faecalis]|mgnify:FL=1|jgi:proline iminopeptidase|uniref:Proline iminopeptidase n=3 Tax=Heyndrickxia TaxID=2837504 RepID=G2TN50_HEYCO|nr:MULTISPECIES: proline iminopeptidase-family hydrolase [Heyndrickxia]NWN95450.1 proline iminopeptidase-family hydrolase [Bacillus sp. (in: firmicutes)]AEP01352.1 proline-specific peptidase [Heyndrickxia coagulans 36D1]APB37006.1 proline iminopeptidase [Heyndrickxia coagulans]AWP37965.1 proline iminopeptidase [Heyndrickxia coagulans]KGT38550.1 proline iminopeptidase [Heyndrickxia coagulans P38]
MAEGYVKVTGGNVFYKITGTGSKTPLIVLHGGPGGTHMPFFALEALGDERPVVFYDQLGSGRSDHPDDPLLWTIDRFTEELARLREALALDKVHILGHSWGTMLAANYLLKQPAGVKSVIFSGPCLSAPQWKEDQDEHRKQLPPDVQEILARSEREGRTSSPEYKEAMKVFYKKFVNRLEEKPAVLQSEFARPNEEVYLTMWGPSEFYPSGNLKTFDVTGRLHEIRLPALFTCGRYDEARPETTRAYSRLIPGAKFHMFENSSHQPYLEEPHEFVRVIREFLAGV